MFVVLFVYYVLVCFICCFVFGDVFGECMEWKVGSDEGDVMKEWCGGVIFGVVVKIIDCVVCGSNCCVVVRFVIRNCNVNVVNCIVFGVEEVVLIFYVE